MEPETEPSEHIEEQIHLFEINNAELLTDVPDDVEMTLPEIPDGPPAAKLKALQQINQLYVDAINGELPKKPKFGSGLAVAMHLKIKGEPKIVWVDENQTGR